MNNRKPAQIQLQNLPIDGQTDDIYDGNRISHLNPHNRGLMCIKNSQVNIKCTCLYEYRASGITMAGQRDDNDDAVAELPPLDSNLDR